MANQFDVIVVGGGHAGCEAAAAAARMGAFVGLITMRSDRIGEMSCNPAIGGLGKGHLVREIDALDGLMGRAIDQAGIQFRMLNKSRGPAVHGPRAQADRALYRTAIQNFLAEYDNIRIIEAAVGDILVKKTHHGNQVKGIMTEDGHTYHCTTIVLTTGTFLGGLIHLGGERTPAGRVGEGPSNKLALRLAEMQLPIGRLKTGTPARLDGTTIDWESLEMQPADDPPVPFSTLTDKIRVPQISCGITRTTAQTHKIIAKSIHLSAVYSGQILGTGPRYCPSIEDKIQRFADKKSHQIFLEPEGLDDPTVYPNGISTSLPRDVQSAMIASIPGLEAAKILQFGYAIEYDFVDPRSLSRSLALKALPSLHLAGQINGTTGYEEAAAQGLIAGVNAALMAGNGSDYTPFVLDRAAAYIGVMIDDLITKGAPEPYRMFTSRAEYRLLLRADNADQRLTDYGVAIGCVGMARKNAWRCKAQALAAARAQLATNSRSAKAIAAAGLPAPRDGGARTGADLLALEGIGIADILPLWPEHAAISPDFYSQLEADYRYAGYTARQQADIDALRRDEAVLIPPHTDFAMIGGLSTESKDILRRFQPETIGHANRLPGLTPAAVVAILHHIKKQRKQNDTRKQRSLQKGSIVTADEVGKLLNVSRETMCRFEAYLALLEKWQRRINLVANGTMVDAWQRHILDSAQLVRFYPPNTKKILDVGSGAGFPGLVLAIMGNVQVDLVESDQRKAIFLSTVIRSLGLPAKVHNQRIESLSSLAPDVVTARALAPVSKLMKLIENQILPDTVCLFLKGASVEDELTDLQSYSTMVPVSHPSLSDSNGVVLELKYNR